MLDTSKLTFRWNLILYTPTIVALVWAILAGRAVASNIPSIGWFVLNILCSLWCAFNCTKSTTNRLLRIANVIGFSFLFWIVNATTSTIGSWLWIAFGAQS